MVKPAFQDLEADLWVHPGKLGIAQPSVCIFHDRPDAGAQIVEALAELVDDSRPAQRTVTFKPCSRPRALEKLKLRLEPIDDELRVMHIALDRDTAIIRITDEGLSLLMKAFASWLDGADDFGVSPRHSGRKPKALGKLDKESGELWFWGPRYAGP